MKSLNSHSWWTVILTGLVLNLAAAPLKIELPPETGTFKPGRGVEIANGQCLVCHSVEYVATQPPLPRTFWASSVKKMREKYGSTIPEEQVEALLDYLTAHYGIAPTNQVSTLITNAAPQVKLESAPDAAAIAAKYGCLAC
ncbi:MAG TPA: cytochrome c, partial [Verrucomicrobiae bacterium]|nr:cytochrome c [Verrucomicrobiae bacterium]